MENSTATIDPVALLGSVTDVWILIILIVPGFITYQIYSRIASHEIETKKFQLIMYSLVGSLIVFFPISFILNIQSLTDLKEISITPYTIAIWFVFAIIIGIGGGYLHRVLFARQIGAGLWDTFTELHSGDWVMVYTTDDKEFLGWLKRISHMKTGKQELTLGDPSIIKKENNTRTSVSMGKELFIVEKNIKRILILRNIEDSPPQ